MNIRETVEAQRAYFQSGATLSREARCTALLKLKEGIKRHEEEITEALHSDLGKSPTEAYMTEIASLYSDIDHAIRHLKGWMRPHRVSTPLSLAPASSRVVQNPYGVTLIIAPWNYPILLTLSPLIGALAAGNCAVLKPSESASACAKVISKLLSSCLDEQLVTVINGDAEVAKSLLNEHFDFIFYTGNAQVARYVMEKAARHLTPILLELGGKSPVIVTRSANLRLAARRIAFGKWTNAGQTCVAPDYVLVEECVHDAFVKHLREQTEAMYGTHPLANSAYGKIINRHHFHRLLQLILPQKVLFGGEADSQSLRIAPTVLDHVQPQDAVMGEEIFGPILPVLTIANLEEAISFISSRPHPLALYLFTSSRHEEHRVMNSCIWPTIICPSAASVSRAWAPTRVTIPSSLSAIPRASSPPPHGSTSPSATSPTPSSRTGLSGSSPAELHPGCTPRKLTYLSEIHPISHGTQSCGPQTCVP